MSDKKHSKDLINPKIKHIGIFSRIRDKKFMLTTKESINQIALRTKNAYSLTNWQKIQSKFNPVSWLKFLQKSTLTQSLVIYTAFVAILNWQIFNFEDYFSYRSLGLVPDKNVIIQKSFGNINTWLQQFNLYWLDYNLSSELFYKVVFTLVFTFGAFGVGYLSLLIRYQILPLRDGDQGWKILIQNIFILFCVTFSIYNSLTLNYFWEGNFNLLIGYFSTILMLVVLNFNFALYPFAKVFKENDKQIISSNRFKIALLYIITLFGVISIAVITPFLAVCLSVLILCLSVYFFVNEYLNYRKNTKSIYDFHDSIFNRIHWFNLIIKYISPVLFLIGASIMMYNLGGEYQLGLQSNYYEKNILLNNHPEFKIYLENEKVITVMSILILIFSLVFISKFGLKSTINKVYAFALALVYTTLSITGILIFKNSMNYVNYYQKPTILKQINQYCTNSKTVLILPFNKEFTTFFSKNVPISARNLFLNCKLVNITNERKLKINELVSDYIDKKFTDNEQVEKINARNQLIVNLVENTKANYILIESENDPSLAKLNINLDNDNVLLEQDTMKFYSTNLAVETNIKN